MSKVTHVPAIPTIGRDTGQIVAGLTAMKEAIEVGYGRRGDRMDAFITRRELQDAGLARFGAGGYGMRAGRLITQGPQVGVDVPGTINGLPDNSPPNYGQNDYTPPPMPTNVTVQPIAPNQIMVLFDPPNYGNHAFAEIYYIPESVGTTYSTFIANSGAFNLSKPCTGAASGTNPNPHFKGRFEGSNPILELTGSNNPGSTSLGAALNPPAVYVFVRFVSLAKVAGPVGPQGTGAAGRASIDPVRVLDLMTRDVMASGVYTNLRAFIGSDPTALEIITRNGRGVTSILNDTISHENTFSQLWTVRQERTLADGSIVAAGFGLGITEDNTAGTAQSLFAVNADKFAIMGSGTPMVPINGYAVTSDPTVAMINVAQSAAFKVGQSVLIKSNPSGNNGDGLEGVIITLNSMVLTVKKSVPAFTAPELPQPNPNWPGFIQGVNFLTGATNIPFIVDTLHSVVGIRGKLIVDGLIRATEGDFNILRANTAFIGTIRAGVVNANILVGQSIIAGDGLPNGATVNDINTINAWIVQLSRVTPGVNSYPFRIYNPARAAAGLPGSEIFALTAGDPTSQIPEWQVPHLRLRGNLEIGGSAVFNPRLGGAAAIGNKSSDGLHYTFWCGADTDYNTTAENMDDNGAFWVRPRRTFEPGNYRFRAGLNAELILGGLPFAQPSIVAENNDGASYTSPSLGVRATSVVTTVMSAESLTVRSTGQGGPSRILVVGSCNLARANGRGGEKRFSLALRLVGNNGAEYQVQQFELDDYAPESYAATLTGVATVPAGEYRAKIELTNYPQGDNGQMSILRGWTCYAQYVRGKHDLLQNLGP